MNFSIITEYPSWFILFCLLAGAVYAFLLYRKGAATQDFPPVILRLITAFRFIVVSILCFLLLGPMLRSVMRTVEKPVIIVAVDNSQSIVASKDSVTRKKSVLEMLEKLKGSLQSNYELHTFTFGDKVKEGNPDFNDRITDFSELYNELNVQFLNRNVGAMIIASDGIYNQGSSPVGGPVRIKAPMYTMALGDTTVYRDLVLTGADHNKTAFLGNSFPLEIRIDARQSSGSSTELTIEEEGIIISKRTINISGNRYHTTIPVFIDAKSKGLKHYRIALTGISGEATILNNSRDIYIEVVESKQKVLIVAAAPHPDLAALKSAIESSQNYEVVLKYAYDFNGNASGMNLVILHGLPNTSLGSFNEWLKKWKQDNLSLWYIVTASTDINAFNANQTGIRITSSNGSLNETQPVMSDAFSLFSVSDELQQVFNSWPPLSVPFGEYRMESNGYNFLTQRIGTVVTTQPLFSFIPTNTNKTAVLNGEGIWKWRMAEFEQNGNSNLFREWVSRTVQYMAATGNRSPFRLQYKNSYAENEQITFNAELYDASGQLVNEPEVKVTITSSEGKQFGFAFSRTDKAYTLNAGLLPAGRYRFKAETKLGDKLYAESGEFSINALQLETVNTIADHQLLYAMASRNGGAMFYPGQENQLLDAITKREDITAVSYQQKKLTDLVEQPWVFILLILLLSAEWFLRKRNGVY